MAVGNDQMLKRVGGTMALKAVVALKARYPRPSQKRQASSSRGSLQKVLAKRSACLYKPVAGGPSD